MFKATSVVAGAKVITILVSFVRLKVAALFLGPGGFGLLNLIVTATELFRVVSSLGLDGATVKRVAKAVGDEDPEAISRAYHASVRLAVFIGVMAWLLCSVLSPWLSQAAFDDYAHAWLYVVGGASLLFIPLLGVQLAFIQGLRKVKVLATCQILTSLATALVSLALILAFAETGGVVALAVSALASLLIHLKYVAPFRPPRPAGERVAFFSEVRSLLGAGSGFAINGLWLTASSWLNLLLLRQHYGADGTHQVGLYSAASMLSTFCFGIIFSAMATEFYPALAASSRDERALQKLLNHQTLMAVAVGATASVIAMVMAPLALALAYSSEFVEAAHLMRLLLAAMALRFATCPLGFVLLAKGKMKVMAFCELGIGTVVIGTSIVMLKFYGIMGLGYAMILSNTIHLLGMVAVNRWVGVAWDRKTFLVIVTTVLAIVGILLATAYLPAPYGGLAAGSIAGLFGLRMAFVLSREMEIGIAEIVARAKRMLPRRCKGGR